MEHGKLKRTLKTSNLIIFGLVFMIPLAPAGMYGVYLAPSGGMVALCYLIGMVAMFFTGMSYRVMLQKFPMAGSVYVYVQKGVSPTLGFLTGWAILLYYFLMPATVVIIERYPSIFVNIFSNKYKVVVFPYCLGLFIIKYFPLSISFMVSFNLLDVSTI